MRICFWENILQRIYFENMFVRIYFHPLEFLRKSQRCKVLTSSTKSICFCADMRSGLLLILKDNHSLKIGVHVGGSSTFCFCGAHRVTQTQRVAHRWTHPRVLEIISWKESVMNLENIQSCEKLPSTVKMGKDATLVYSWLKKLGQPAS